MSEFRLADELRRLDGPVTPDDGFSDELWSRLAGAFEESVSTGSDRARLGRGILVAAVAGIAVLAVIVPVLFFSSGAGPVGSSETTDRVEEWIDGALNGDFEDIARLTYGEFGEPDALDRLARLIHSHAERYGSPTVGITPYEVEHTFDFTCVELNFGGAILTGAMVTRSWPELGPRLWEFRSNMEGCLGFSVVTTTMPDLSGVGDPLPHEALGPEPRFDTSELGEEVRLLPIDVRTPPFGLRAEGDVTVIGRVEGSDVEIYLDRGERLCVWFIGTRLTEARCSLSDQAESGFSSPAYAVIRGGLGGEARQAIVMWRVADGTSVVALDAGSVARWQRPVGGHVFFVLDGATPTGLGLANVTAYDIAGEILGGSGVDVPVPEQPGDTVPRGTGEDPPFVPATTTSAGRTILPLLFPDGTSIEVSYPDNWDVTSHGLSIGGSGQVPGYGRDFHIRYAPVGRLAEQYSWELLDTYFGADGQPVHFYRLPGESIDYLAFQFGPWAVLVYDYRYSRDGPRMTDEARQTWATALLGSVTEDGFLVLDAQPPLRLAQAGEHAGPHLGISGDDGGLSLYLDACEAAGVDRTEDRASWCAEPEGIRIHASGSPAFQAALPDALRVTR